MIDALTDQLADTWRWWTSLGAALAILELVPWLRKQIRTEDPIRLSRTVKIVIATVLIGAMFGFVLAGAIIPFANDDRLDWFTREHLLYRGGIASAWLLWGCCAWGTAIVLAKGRWVQMLSGSVAWWLAMFFAVAETAGARLG